MKSLRVLIIFFFFSGYSGYGFAQFPSIPEKKTPDYIESNEIIQHYNLKPPTTLTEEEWSVLAYSYDRIGEVKNAGMTYKKALQYFPGSEELKKSYEINKRRQNLKQRYITNLENRFSAQIEKLRHDQRRTDSLTLAISIMKYIGDIADGRVQIVMSWNENGQRKSGRVFIGAKVLKACNIAFNSFAAKGHVDNLYSLTDKGTALLFGLERTESLRMGLVYIEKGPFKGAYYNPNRVKIQDSLVYEIFFPGRKYFGL